MAASNGCGGRGPEERGSARLSEAQRETLRERERVVGVVPITSLRARRIGGAAHEKDRETAYTAWSQSGLVSLERGCYTVVRDSGVQWCCGVRDSEGGLLKTRCEMKHVFLHFNFGPEEIRIFC